MINIFIKYGKNPNTKFSAKVKSIWDTKVKCARWDLILYREYVFLVDIKMDEIFCAFCITLLVSGVCRNYYKNQPSTVVKKIIAIYSLQSYQYKTILQFFVRADMKMPLRTLKTRLTQVKLCCRNFMSETTAQNLNIAIFVGIVWTKNKFRL